MSPARTPPRLITLILLTGLATLSLNMFVPSLPAIAAEFGVDYSLVSISIAGYLALTAVIQLIVGPLSDNIGRRPVLLVALAVFTLASVAAAQAQNIWVFLAFRMLQGGMVSGFALSLAIVRDTTTEQKAAGLIGYIAMCMALAPMVGPMIGGVLESGFGWRANFYLYTVFGAALLTLCWVDLGETRPTRNPASPGAPARATDLLRRPVFWAYAGCSAFSVGAFYIFIAGTPLVALTVFGVTTSELGLLLGTITMGYMVGSFLANRFAGRFAPGVLMISGRVVACSGLSIGLIVFLAGAASPVVFFASTVFVGLGNGLTLPGSHASAVSIRPDLAGTASGVLGASVVAVGAILTMLTGIAVTGTAPATTLLAIMLASAVVALVAALAAIHLRNNTPQEA